MSSGGEPELGSGGFYGGDSGGGGGAGGLGGLGGGVGPGLGGLLGSLGPLGGMHPRGSYGIWPSCGCGSLIIILAGILLVCGGCLQLLNQ